MYAPRCGDLAGLALLGPLRTRPRFSLTGAFSRDSPSVTLFACCRRKRKPKPPVPKPPAPPVPPVPPVGVKVELVNRSTVVTDTDVIACAGALTVQAQRDYSPLWGTSATVHAVTKNATPAADAWQILVLDDSDQAGALGYHDLTPQGKPLGKVFAKTDQQYAEDWHVTASHELLEMLGDPNINKEITRRSNGWKYIYENCDAVEGDEYKIGPVSVSDFVTPAWFHEGAVGPYDFLRLVKKPFELRPGGYISVDEGDGWTQIYGQKGAQQHGYSSRPKVGSRRERRRVPRADWLRSIE